MPMCYWFWHWATGAMLAFEGRALWFATRVRAVSAYCSRRTNAIVEEID